MTAFISQKLGRLIVVGGFATSLYSRGAYTTLDVDVVPAYGVDVGRLEEGLKEIGFKRVNGALYSEVADCVLDLLPPREPERTRTFEIDGYEVDVTSPEDAIVNDLACYKGWDAPSCFERASLAYEAQRGELDAKYLQKRAREERVEDALAELSGAEEGSPD